MENIDIDKLTPMMKIYCETKEQYKDCIFCFTVWAISTKCSLTMP